MVGCWQAGRVSSPLTTASILRFSIIPQKHLVCHLSVYCVEQASELQWRARSSAICAVRVDDATCGSKFVFLSEGVPIRAVGSRHQMSSGASLWAPPARDLALATREEWGGEACEVTFSKPPHSPHPSKPLSIPSIQTTLAHASLQAIKPPQAKLDRDHSCLAGSGSRLILKLGGVGRFMPCWRAEAMMGFQNVSTPARQIELPKKTNSAISHHSLVYRARLASLVSPPVAHDSCAMLLYSYVVDY